jgi:purine-binding chemotaxis protein CheW
MENDANKIMERQLVLFDLGGEVYGVDIAAVHEIIRMQPITRVPKAPFYVEGVINLRGKVIPVVDMRKRFGLAKVEQTKDNRIVVVDSSGQNIGIIVDAVTEVLRIPADSVETPSEIITTTDSDYLLGIAKRDETMIILLDLDKVLSMASDSSQELKIQEQQTGEDTTQESSDSEEAISEAGKVKEIFQQVDENKETEEEQSIELNLESGEEPEIDETAKSEQEAVSAN